MAEPRAPAEPSHQVGTRVLFENDRVRVWEMVLRPGEESTRHVHESDYLFVYLSHSKIQLMTDDGPPETSEQRPGFVQYTDVGQGIVHAVKNVGDSEHREILVELKGPSRTSRPSAPETNDPGD
jgi:quercetin dioxygenase-like cupin family protein